MKSLVCWMLLFVAPASGAVVINFDPLIPFGTVDGNGDFIISGNVSGLANPQDYVGCAVIQIEGAGWYSKPGWDVGFNRTSIDENGDWQTDINYYTGPNSLDKYATVIGFAVYPKSASWPTNPDSTIPLFRSTPGLYKADGLPVAYQWYNPTTITPYTAFAHVERYGPTIPWQGYNWAVKTSNAPVGPGVVGNNIFPGTSDFAKVVAGNMVLTAKATQDTPSSPIVLYGSEIILTDPTGYGKYTWITTNTILPPSITQAGFTYDVFGNGARGLCNNTQRELDIEYGNPGSPHGIIPIGTQVSAETGWRVGDGVNVYPERQIAVQPWNNTIGGTQNLERFDLPLGELRNIIDWSPTKVDFTIETLDGTFVKKWSYRNRDIPDPGHAQFRFNTWMHNNTLTDPTDMVIKSFSFTPMAPMPTKLWTGHGELVQDYMWAVDSNWTALPESPGLGFGQKLVLGRTGSYIDALGVSRIDLLFNDLQKVGHIVMEGAVPVRIQSNYGQLVLDNENWFISFIDVKTGLVPHRDEINAPIHLASHLQVTVDSAADSIAFYGNLSGAGALAKSGPGKLIINTTANYEGGTHVNQGVLEVRRYDALPPFASGFKGKSKVIVNDGGTLLVDIGTGTMNIQSIDCEYGCYPGDTIVASGSLVVDYIVQDTLTIGAGASVTIRETTTQITEVPEPGVLLLVCVGLAALILGRKLWIG